MQRNAPHSPRALPHAQRQRGSLAIEAALMLPLLIGIGVLGADMQRVHTERIRLEKAAGALGVNVAAQPALTKPGLDRLAAITMQGHEEAQQITVMYIEPNGQVRWAVQRGGAANLCAAPIKAGIYSGTWPGEKRPDGRTDDTEAARPEAITRGQIAVQACRDTAAIQLSSGLVLPAVIETQAIYPAFKSAVLFDKDLLLESRSTGLAYAK